MLVMLGRGGAMQKEVVVSENFTADSQTASKTGREVSLMKK